jgi:hypothetical protein
MFKIFRQNFIKINGRYPIQTIYEDAATKAASQANKGQVIQFPQKRNFAEEIKAMDGTIKVGEVTKKNDNVLTREMFKNSDLNKPTIEGQMLLENRIKEMKTNRLTCTT